MTEEMIKKDAAHTEHKCECITVRPVADVTDEKDGVEICFEVPGSSSDDIRLTGKTRIK